MDPQRTIALETSTRRGSLALADRGALVEEIELTADRRHTSELLPAIRDACARAGWKPADIDSVCFSAGPGSFTGLRVAATVARMLQWSLGCRVAAVPTLEAIAANVSQSGRIAAILDAKREQVFGAAFERDAAGRLRTTAEAALQDPREWLAGIEKPFRVIGEGISRHRDACVAAGADLCDESLWRPRAALVAEIGIDMLMEGRDCRPEDVKPHYLRRPEAEEVYEQRRAEARQRRGE